MILRRLILKNWQAFYWGELRDLLNQASKSDNAPRIFNAQTRKASQDNINEQINEVGPNTRVIAVSSGKGGVGKTNLVVNLAITLAGLGKRV
ncbi:MAG: AAA family ATPase, partial [Peptococcaceae bacterium]|nr:AAA family ATPase [Peptococcaceae bacterium]